MGHDPLFAPGIHDQSLDDLEAACVTAFNEGKHREELFENFRSLCEELHKNLGIDCKLWVNGSFVTEKEKPNDIDVVCIAPRSEVNSLNGSDQTRLAKLVRTQLSKIAYDTDLYFCPEGDSSGLDYWKNQFGSDRSGSDKGIASIKLTDK